MTKISKRKRENRQIPTVLPPVIENLSQWQKFKNFVSRNRTKIAIIGTAAATSLAWSLYAKKARKRLEEDYYRKNATIQGLQLELDDKKFKIQNMMGEMTRNRIEAEKEANIYKKKLEEIRIANQNIDLVNREEREQMKEKEKILREEIKRLENQSDDFRKNYYEAKKFKDEQDAIYLKKFEKLNDELNEINKSYEELKSTPTLIEGSKKLRKNIRKIETEFDKLQRLRAEALESISNNPAYNPFYEEKK